MPYPQRLLNRHEEVAADLHPHWSYYALPAFVLVAAVVLGVLTLTSTDAATTPRTTLIGLSLVVLVGSMVWLIVRYARWATTRFVVTSDRIIFRGGVVAKRGVEIPLERVNAVHYRQSVVERLLGTGEIIIETGGDDGQHRFTAVRRPGEVQRLIHAQLEEHGRRQVAAAAAGAQFDVATQLERLEGMLQRGTLTVEEFQAHKDRLLRH